LVFTIAAQGDRRPAIHDRWIDDLCPDRLAVHLDLSGDQGLFLADLSVRGAGNRRCKIPSLGRGVEHAHELNHMLSAPRFHPDLSIGIDDDFDDGGIAKRCGKRFQIGRKKTGFFCRLVHQ
jgi:hypothetical protein